MPFQTSPSCPHCNAAMNVMYSKPIKDGWRADVFECPKCWFVHTEIEQETKPLPGA